jgi:hypothetical protein
MFGLDFKEIFLIIVILALCAFFLKKLGDFIERNS